MSSDGVPLLWHLKVSNYNEKARWALDYKGIPHVRRAAVPGSHVKIAKKLGGGETFPVLVLNGQAIGDSTEIIAALERLRPEPALYPADPDDRRRALELEDFFDEELGPHSRLLTVHHMLRDPKVLLRGFFPDASRLRYGTGRALYPVIRRMFRSGLAIDEENVELAWRKCRAAGERFRAELQRSGYLIGERFSVADLTLAALVAPPLAPEQFPYPQPQRGHPALAPMREMFDEYGLVDWVREIYARHRGSSAEVASSAQPERPASVAA